MDDLKLVVSLSHIQDKDTTEKMMFAVLRHFCLCRCVHHSLDGMRFAWCFIRRRRHCDRGDFPASRKQPIQSLTAVPGYGAPGLNRAAEFTQLDGYSRCGLALAIGSRSLAGWARIPLIRRWWEGLSFPSLLPPL